MSQTSRVAGLAAFLVVAASAVAQAQTVQPPSSAPLVVRGLGTGSVPLDGFWSFNTGDDPAWSAPGFDDNGWPQIDVARPWGQQGYWAYSGFAWYRRRIDFGQAGEVALYMPSALGVYEMYWNGRPVGGYGPLPSDPSRQAVPAAVYRLESPGSGELAFRIWTRPNDTSTGGDDLGLAAAPIAANPETAQNLLTIGRAQTFRDGLDAYVQIPLYAQLALIGALAWLRNRGQKLLFWMVLYCLSSFFFIAFNPNAAAPLITIGRVFLSSPFHSLNDVALWYLLIYLLHLDRYEALWRWTRVLAWITLISALFDDLIFSFVWSSLHVSAFHILDAIFTAGFSIPEVWPLVLVALALRERLSASRWWVAITAFLYEMYYVTWHSSLEGQRFTHWTLGEEMYRPILRIAGVPLLVPDILSTLLILAIVYAVYRYVVEEAQRQRAVREELKSAQELQRVLIPEALPPLPGFAVTSAYQPAAEVGGDFFQLIAVNGDAAMLALGDVSGKGLKAAMTVSLIVGSLRTLAETTSQPEEILAGLNRRLCGRVPQGFVTCMLMRLTKNGECVVASAGHPAPFLNAEEIALPGALPLGLDPEQRYQAFPVRLNVGDRLTAYTDGLLEARNAAGEIFGFRRLEKLIAAGPDARRAVEAAVAFGQEDDITVLTLTRLAVGVESTTSLLAPQLEPLTA
jgi:hypothetical protein